MTQLVASWPELREAFERGYRCGQADATTGDGTLEAGWDEFKRLPVEPVEREHPVLTDIEMVRLAKAAVKKAKRVIVMNYYRPSDRQWEVLFALRDGPLLSSSYTVAGAHVHRHCAQALADRGLVKIDARAMGDTMVELTAAGRARIERGY